MSDEIDVPVRLSWHVICKLACRAMILRVSMNDLCIAALESAIRQEGGK